MMADAARSWPEAAGSLALTVLAGLLVLLAALAVLFVLPAALVIVTMGYPGDAAPAAGVGNWLFLAWFPPAFLGAIYTIATGLAIMERPRLGGVAGLLALAALLFFTFPPFLFPAQ